MGFVDRCTSLVVPRSNITSVSPGFHKVNMELKQTDAAAVRRRPASKSPFKRAQGQVNSVGPRHQLNGDLPVDRRRVSLLKFPNLDHGNDQFFSQNKATAQPHNCFAFCVVVVKFAANGNQASK